MIKAPAPCTPEAVGLDRDSEDGKTFLRLMDKRRTTTMARKQDEFIDSYCSACPNNVAAFCEAQGFYTNLEGEVKIADGIFGGYTEAERKVRGPRKFDLSEL